MTTPRNGGDAGEDFTLDDWNRAQRRIDREQVVDGRPLLERVSEEFLASRSPAEILAMKYEPRCYLRPRQIPPPTDPDDPWLVLVYLTGRGWGKSLASMAWLANEVLTNRPARPATYGLVAPTLPETWSIQFETLKPLLPPWVRWVERRTHDEIVFPDHGVTLRCYSAQSPEIRGPNLRGAVCTELTKYSRGTELFRNLRLAVRVPGKTPPRIVCDCTPPQELNWILRLCAERTTKVVRGAMRDNPALDARIVEAAYRELGNTPSARRELGGEVCLGADRALVSVEAVERSRVAAAPPLVSVACGVDPALSGSKYADTTGIVIAGVDGAGDVYVLRSCSEQLEPEEWSARTIAWCRELGVGRIAVEHASGSGGAVARAVLAAEMRASRWQRPILDSYARGPKRDRGQVLATLFARQRIHLVGRHEALERDLTQWEPGSNWSPGALDAAVHCVSLLTIGYTR